MFFSFLSCFNLDLVIFAFFLFPGCHWSTRVPNWSPVATSSKPFRLSSSTGLAWLSRSRLALFSSQKFDVFKAGFKTTPAQVTRTKLTRQNSSAFLQHSGQNGIILSCMYFHFRSMRISFISKVTRVYRATDSRERYKFMFHRFGCVSWILSRSTGLKFPYEQTTNSRSSNQPGYLAHMKRLLAAANAVGPCLGSGPFPAAVRERSLRLKCLGRQIDRQLREVKRIMGRKWGPTKSGSISVSGQLHAHLPLP